MRRQATSPQTPPPSGSTAASDGLGRASAPRTRAPASGPGRLHREVDLARRQGQTRRQVAVGGEDVDVQPRQAAVERAAVRVAELHPDLAAEIGGARGGEARALPALAEQARPAFDRVVAAGARGGIARAHGVEWAEGADLLPVRPEAFHAGDREDLVVERARAVHHHVVLLVLRLDLDGLRAAREEVHGGRGEERELVLRHHAIERRFEAIEKHDQFDPAAIGAPDQRLQPVERHEQEALRQGEVLAQQAEAGEAARRRREQRLLLAETDARTRVRPPRAPPRRPACSPAAPRGRRRGRPALRRADGRRDRGPRGGAPGDRARGRRSARRRPWSSA